MTVVAAGPNLQRIMICIRVSSWSSTTTAVRQSLTSRSSIAHNARRNRKQKYIFSECCLPLDVILLLVFFGRLML
jgi:hypothetical protein